MPTPLFIQDSLFNKEVLEFSFSSLIIDINKEVSEVSPLYKYISGPKATAKILEAPHSNKLR